MTDNADLEAPLTPSGATILEQGVTTNKPSSPDILSLAVNGVHRSPACWNADEFRRRGYEVGFGGAHLCPDHAEFDLWVETPGTGWYQMCQEAGYEGFDGSHPAIAIELNRCWLSWNESSDSLQARLLGDHSER